jgi:hypothetical protein
LASIGAAKAFNICSSSAVSVSGIDAAPGDGVVCRDDSAGSPLTEDMQLPERAHAGFLGCC